MTINENNLQKQNNTFTLATSQKYASENIIINTQVKKAILTSDSNSNSFDLEYPNGANNTDTVTFTTSNNTTIATHDDGRSVNLNDVNSTASYKDVIFIDYDGTIRYSYTTAQFASLTALPPNPSHSGLIAQGWNWTLANAKTAVVEYGYLTIGQNYITDDNTTRIYIHLDDKLKSPRVGIGINGSVDVDWGDGSTHGTITGTASDTLAYSDSHTYASGGDYVIKLTITGTAYLRGVQNGSGGCKLLCHSSGNNSFNRYYTNAIKKVQIGANIERIQNSSFYNCYSLASISIPTALNYATAGMYAFYNCHALIGIVLPNGIQQLNDQIFRYCYSIKYISNPFGVYVLASYNFDNCQALQQLYIKTTSKTIKKNICYYAHALSKITLPSSLTTIEDNAFTNCYALQQMTIPASVETIGTAVFQNCGAIKELHFKPTVPPTAAASTTFSGLSTDCTIYVPTGYLTAYTSEANYPDSSLYTYVEE